MTLERQCGKTETESRQTSHGRGTTAPTIKPAVLEVTIGTAEWEWCRWTPELWYER